MYVSWSTVCFLASLAASFKIWGVEPGEDLHERRLPRPILAHHCMDLAGANIQRDIGQGVRSVERLMQAPHMQEQIPGSNYFAVHASECRRNWAGALDDRPAAPARTAERSSLVFGKRCA